MITTLLALALVSYFAASAAYHVQLFAGSSRGHQFARVTSGVGLLLNLSGIGAWCLSHTGSILRDPTMPYSLVAFFLVAAQLAVDLFRGWSALGSLTLPLAVICQFSATLALKAVEPDATTPPAILSPHVLALLLGFVAFTLAFSMAVLHLAQTSLLKAKRLQGIFSRLPSIESARTGAHFMAIVGFSLLSLGIVTGAMAAPGTWGARWYLDLRTVSSVAAWAVYAAYLGAIEILGWRGRRTMYFLLVGFVAILLAFLASVNRGAGRTALETPRSQSTSGIPS